MPSLVLTSSLPLDFTKPVTGPAYEPAIARGVDIDRLVLMPGTYLELDDGSLVPEDEA